MKGRVGTEGKREMPELHKRDYNIMQVLRAGGCIHKYNRVQVINRNLKNH